MQMKQILVVFANPEGTDPLRLGNENKAILDSVKLSKNRDNLSIDFRHAATTHDVRRSLLEENYNIIHFSGHGTGKGLAFENELGEIQIVPQAALAELLAAYSPPLECALLNACYTQEQGNLFSLRIPYTIAMSGPISDPSAIEFTRGFYDAIGAGKDIEFAYNEGCRAVDLAGLKDDLDPVFITSIQEEMKVFFHSCLPQAERQSDTSLPSWLQGDCLRVFESSIHRARFSELGLLTTRHILLALLELENGISKTAIKYIGGDVGIIAKEISNNIDNDTESNQRVRATKSVRELIETLNINSTAKGSNYLDDGIIFQVALEQDADSVTIVELLNDLKCEKEKLLQSIAQVRKAQDSTPSRKI